MASTECKNVSLLSELKFHVSNWKGLAEIKMFVQTNLYQCINCEIKRALDLRSTPTACFIYIIERKRSMSLGVVFEVSFCMVVP